MKVLKRSISATIVVFATVIAIGVIMSASSGNAVKSGANLLPTSNRPIFRVAAPGESPEAPKATVCELPVSYFIDSVDPRFGLTQEEIADFALRAEKRWEDVAEKNIFVHDQSNKNGTPIEFVFDERQDIALKWSAYKKLQEQFNVLEESYGKDVAVYNQLHQTQRTYEEWDRLDTTWIKLDASYSALDKAREELAALSEQHTAGRPAGLGSKRKIIVYSFFDDEDLVLVLAHEMGHIFIPVHATATSSLMYASLDPSAVISSEDIQLLRKFCPAI